MCGSSDGTILPRQARRAAFRSPTTTPHAPAGAGDHGHGRFDVGAVEVGHLLLGDLADVILADGGHLVPLGTPEAVSMPQAFLISSAAGGVLVTKVKLRSAYTVMTTGIIMPMSPLVRSLKSLVNWAMSRRIVPGPGPQGGRASPCPRGPGISHSQLFSVPLFVHLQMFWFMVPAEPSSAGMPPHLRAAGDTGNRTSYQSLTGSTWSSSRSTGVSRPNMDTMTRTRSLSASSSSTVPRKPSRGPSTTFTVSPSA